MGTVKAVSAYFTLVVPKGHRTLIVLLHYLVKCRSHSLATYNNEFILGSACIGSENHWETKNHCIQTTTSVFHKVV